MGMIAYIFARATPFSRERKNTLQGLALAQTVKIRANYYD